MRISDWIMKRPHMVDLPRPPGHQILGCRETEIRCLVAEKTTSSRRISLSFVQHPSSSFRWIDKIQGEPVPPLPAPPLRSLPTSTSPSASVAPPAQGRPAHTHLPASRRGSASRLLGAWLSSPSPPPFPLLKESSGKTREAVEGWVGG